MSWPVDEVRVWKVALDPQPGTTLDLSVLNPAERARAARYMNERARCSFVLTRSALRHILASCLGGDAARLPLAEHAGGKPYLVGDDLAFNVSHSGSIALIAVSRMPVGIDVESDTHSTDWHELEPLICHPAETACLAGLATDIRNTALLRLWTIKEAYLKAIGTGLAIAPHLIRLRHPETLCKHFPAAIRHTVAGAAAWPFTVHRLDDDYLTVISPGTAPVPKRRCCAALATPLAQPRIRLGMFCGNTLDSSCTTSPPPTEAIECALSPETP